MKEDEFEHHKKYFEDGMVINTLNDCITLSSRKPHLLQHALSLYKKVLDTYSLSKIAVEEIHSLIVLEISQNSHKEYKKEELNAMIKV